MWRLAAVVLCCLSLFSAASAQEASFPSDAKGVSQWVADFYVYDDVEHVPDFLAWLQSSDFLTSNKNAVSSTTAFLAAVFSANPDRLRAWISSTDLSGNTKDTVERALWMARRTDLISDVLHDHPDIVAQEPPSMLTVSLSGPSVFDMLWASFFATGDVRYPARLIDVLDPSYSWGNSEAIDTAIRQSAAWSLASNMRFHERILRLVREEARRRTGAVQQTLAKMLDVYNADNKPWPNQSGEFRAMLTLVSEDGLQEFQKPSDQVVRVDELSSAKPGDHIAVKVAFAGMDLTDDLTANVTYSFKIIGPDGALFGGADQRDLMALNGRVPTRFLVFDNSATPIIVFSPGSLNGTYTFEAVVKDNIGHHTLTLSKQITLTN